MILPRKPVPGEPVTAQLVGRIIDYMRRITPLKGPNVELRAGPGGTMICVGAGGAGGSSGEVAGIFPFLIRFVPSAEEGATAVQGDYVVYIPSGALAVNGTSPSPGAFGLPPYTKGDYENQPDWYELPYLQESGDYWLNFAFAPAADVPLAVSIGTRAEYATPEAQSGVEGAIARSVALAAVTVVQPDEDESSAGSVAVRQTTRGPIVYDFGVESLNGAMGNLSVVGSDDPVSIDGVDYYVAVTRDPKSSEIVVGLTTNPPEDGEGDSYCNNISRDGKDALPPDNDISDDGGEAESMNGESMSDGNAISRWPCKKSNLEQQ